MAVVPEANKLGSWFNVDEEYTNALRTKSYDDLYAKLHGQRMEETVSTTVTPSKEDDSELHNLHRFHSSHIPDFLLEPSQESLLAAASTSSCNGGHFHCHLTTLLLDFFEATLQTCIACSSLLSSMERARSHHRSMHRLLLTCSRSSELSSFSRLSSHLELGKPLSPKSLSHFNLIHSTYPPLISRLTSAHRKIVRKQKMVHLVKLFSAMPIGRWLKGRVRLERARERMDVAAKGAYIVGRDLDTVSVIVRRVHDEVEHGREVARMVVRNKEWQMVKDVVREMEGRGEEVGIGLEAQLEELEEHVYLCLITINRSRRLVSDMVNKWA